MLLLTIYSTISDEDSLTVVAALVGVNKRFKLPEVIEESNVPNDEPVVAISPYCVINAFVPS